MELLDFDEWSDFINPKTARPFYGIDSDFRMIETDERYLQLGFKLQDVGCCRVIEHEDWGTDIYVTCIFTTAPYQSEHLLGILKSVQDKFKM